MVRAGKRNKTPTNADESSALVAQSSVVKSELSATQKQRLDNLGRRLAEKNTYKLEKSEKTGNYHSAEADITTAVLQAMEASGMADQDAANQLIGQVINAQPYRESLSHANAAVAMLQGIDPQDEIEGLLAAQMVACHNMAMEYARRAMGKELTLEHSDRYINRTTKLMNAFSRHMEVLQKYRANGQQRIVVQHVQVGQGGQAIIGDVQR